MGWGVWLGVWEVWEGGGCHAGRGGIGSNVGGVEPWDGSCPVKEVCLVNVDDLLVLRWRCMYASRLGCLLLMRSGDKATCSTMECLLQSTDSRSGSRGCATAALSMFGLRPWIGLFRDNAGQRRRLPALPDAFGRIHYLQEACAEVVFI